MAGTDRRLTRRAFIQGASAAALGCGCAGVSPDKAPTSEEYLGRRTLGRTGLKVSVLACGVVEEDVLNAALDAGINYLDTARCYPPGRNEETIGKVLKRRKPLRDKIIIATKFQKRCFPKIRPKPPKTYVESVEQSLKALGTDYIDIILQHEATFEDMNDEEVLDAFQKMKKAGKVRFLGAASHVHQSELSVDAAMQSDDYDMFMISYNPFDAAKNSEAILKRAKEKNVGIIAMKAVMLLKGAVHREQNPNFIAEMERRSRNQGDRLNLYQTSIAWVLGHDAIASACVSFGNVQELKEDIAATQVKLSALERIEFRRYVRALACNTCDWCGRCVASCPSGVAVPDIARFLLYYHVACDRDRAREEYARLDAGRRGSDCAECGKCERACPKRLPVRDMLREAESILA